MACFGFSIIYGLVLEHSEYVVFTLGHLDLFFMFYVIYAQKTYELRFGNASQRSHPLQNLSSQLNSGLRSPSCSFSCGLVDTDVVDICLATLALPAHLLLPCPVSTFNSIVLCFPSWPNSVVPYSPTAQAEIQIPI